MAITSPKKKEELSKQFKINPEINAKLDSFMKEEPGLVEYVKDLPREQLERKFLLRKMQDRDQKEGYSAKVKAWLDKPEQGRPCEKHQGYDQPEHETRTAGANHRRPSEKLHP